MDPVATMMEEHRRIELVLDALETYARVIQDEQSDEREELKRFTDFLRGYADRHHHGKEEELLFTAMLEHGFSREAGPIAVMLQDHEEGRALVGEMVRLAEKDATWSEGERKRVTFAARGFVNLLRAHIQKEDQILYPMAAQALPPPVMDAMASAFDTHEEEHRETGEALVRLGDELATRWS